LLYELAASSSPDVLYLSDPSATPWPPKMLADRIVVEPIPDGFAFIFECDDQRDPVNNLA
jgi:hypothetical protein